MYDVLNRLRGGHSNGSTKNDDSPMTRVVHDTEERLTLTRYTGYTVGWSRDGSNRLKSLHIVVPRVWRSLQPWSANTFGGSSAAGARSYWPADIVNLPPVEVVDDEGENDCVRVNPRFEAFEVKRGRVIVFVLVVRPRSGS